MFNYRNINFVELLVNYCKILKIYSFRVYFFLYLTLKIKRQKKSYFVLRTRFWLYCKIFIFPMHYFCTLFQIDLKIVTLQFAIDNLFLVALITSQRSMTSTSILGTFDFSITNHPHTCQCFPLLTTNYPPTVKQTCDNNFNCALTTCVNTIYLCFIMFSFSLFPQPSKTKMATTSPALPT